jgi:TetR/AcrR family tetracycline transcriptional repressor
MPKASTISEEHQEGADDRRIRREPLTRERIIEAALRVMDEEGLEAVTMRRIGRELGVEAMSLYNHVEDKEDILSGIVEAVMGEFRFPEDEPEDWKERARETSREWRRLLKSHPNVITIMSEQRRPPTSLQALRPLEHALGILRSSGLSDEEAVRAYQAFGGFIQGFVMAEVVDMFGEADPHVGPQQLESALPVDELPNLAASLPYIYRCDFDAAFEYGLDLMIRGIEAKVAAGRAER